jgi:hypothetical protein
MPSLEDALCRWNAEEHRFLTFAAEADRAAEFTFADDRLHIAALLVTARREARESKERVAAIAAVARDAS